MANVIIAIILIVWLATILLIVFAVNKKQIDTVELIIKICEGYFERQIIDSYFITNDEVYMLTLDEEKFAKEFESYKLVGTCRLGIYKNKFEEEFKNGNIVEFNISRIKELIDWSKIW